MNLISLDPDVFCLTDIGDAKEACVAPLDSSYQNQLKQGGDSRPDGHLAPPRDDDREDRGPRCVDVLREGWTRPLLRARGGGIVCPVSEMCGVEEPGWCSPRDAPSLNFHGWPEESKLSS